MANFEVFRECGSVTPSDSTEIVFTALYVGVTGDLVIQNLAGDNVTFANVPVGFFPVRGSKVLLTGTTASNIVWGRW